jgi:ABC-type polar amino acid transport system ATPase subunit
MERDVVCVVGPSGSGKTTLLRCLRLLETPSEGRIVMEGVPISTPAQEKPVKAAARAVRSDIGMVFQHFNLWPHMTVLENLIEAPSAGLEGCRRSEAVGDRPDRCSAKGRPLRQARSLSRRGLSGGQQAAGRDLPPRISHAPKGLLFDEATSALDPEIAPRGAAGHAPARPRSMTMLVGHARDGVRAPCRHAHGVQWIRQDRRGGGRARPSSTAPQDGARRAASCRSSRTRQREQRWD